MPGGKGLHVGPGVAAWGADFSQRGVGYDLLLIK